MSEPLRDRPFLVRVDAPEPSAAEETAMALRRTIAARGGRVDVQCRRGVRRFATIGVYDAADGTPRWLAPIALDDASDVATRQLLDFLERWGFLARAAHATPSRPDAKA